MPRKYGKAAQKSVESAMHREKKGTLRSGRSGKKVTSRKQAIAIGVRETPNKNLSIANLSEPVFGITLQLTEELRMIY